MESRIRGIGLIIKDDKLLLVKHRDEEGNQFWTAPGGGVEGGESVQECIEREVREETGLKVLAKQLVAVRQFRQSSIDRNSIELFFLCEHLEASPFMNRTESEIYFMEPPQFIDFHALKDMHVLPPILKEFDWYDRIIKPDSEKITLIIDDEEKKEEDTSEIPEMPLSLREKYEDYFHEAPKLLCPHSSFSNNGPLLIQNKKQEKKVIRSFTRQAGERMLNLNNYLREECKKRFGRPVYALLEGDDSGKPFIFDENRAFLVQEYCKEHRLDVLSDFREFDVFSLGKTCGNIQRILDSVPEDLHPRHKGEHPLAIPLGERIEEIKNYLDPAFLHMPSAYAEWICSETEKTIDTLLGLGAMEFRTTLIDRDLNVRNSSTTFDKEGVATIHSIFDPDFCLGSVSDSLRNPSLSFASRTPRLSLDEILKEDVNTIGGPRWLLFIEGFLETYQLSYEEVLAIPYLEKLEILLFRLFEHVPRYLVPEEYLFKFRRYTKHIINRINNIDWHKRLSHALKGRYTYIFNDMLPDYHEELPPVSPSTVQEYHAIRKKLKHPPKTGTKYVETIDDSWTIVAESDCDEKKRGMIHLIEGYPFPLAMTKIRMEENDPFKDWGLTVHLHGKPLHSMFRSRMRDRIKSRFPDYKIDYKDVPYKEIQRITSPLNENRRTTVVLFDPFRYKGDAFYIGIYFKMLRELNPSCDIMVVSRNEGNWRLFDCDGIQGLSDVPNEFLAAVLPVPIDNQWNEVLRLLPPLLTRTHLILIPQRNLVIRRGYRARIIEIFHARDKEDYNLEFNNISTYTWYGLHCLLPKPIGLNTSLQFMQKIPPSSLSIDERPVFINPLTSHRLKDLTPELCVGIVNIIKRVFDNKNIRILINAGASSKEDKEFADNLQKFLRYSSNVEIWHGKSMNETINMLSSVRLVVTADTSIAHAAGYKGVPCVAIWNTNRWDNESPLDMIHNSPAGFGCLPPTIHNITMTKDHYNEHLHLQDDVNNVEMAILLLKKLCEGNKDFIFKKGCHSNFAEIILKTEQTVERTYSEFTHFYLNLDTFLSEIADRAEEIMNLLNDEWSEWLSSLAPPLAIDWIIERLRKPERTGFNDVQKQRLYALDLWRSSSLWKIINFTMASQ